MTGSNVSLLFVCMGNICRSPSAEGVVRKLAAERGMLDQLVLDSAGTHEYHVGAPPDRRAVTAALRRGIDLSGSRARRVVIEDFHRFDLILAMDTQNLTLLRAMQPPASRARLMRMLDYSRLLPNADVPDPYYGNEAGFEQVLDLLEDSAAGLLEYLTSELQGSRSRVT